MFPALVVMGQLRDSKDGAGSGWQRVSCAVKAYVAQFTDNHSSMGTIHSFTGVRQEPNITYLFVLCLEEMEATRMWPLNSTD